MMTIETLFIIHYIIVDESLHKRRQSPAESISISGGYRNHYVWLLSQSYSAIPKNLKRQAKVMFVWYPNERPDVKMILDENSALTDDELVIVRGFLKTLKHICFYIRNVHSHGFNPIRLGGGGGFLPPH